MQMTEEDMSMNDSNTMKPGQQMGGMDMGQMMMSDQQMGGMDMGQMMKSMPPHYWKSNYHLMSSVKGIEISGLDMVNDKELLVKIKSNSSTPINQNLTLVGGGGDLAGSASVKEGWKNKSEVNLKLEGTGSLFNLQGLHLHLFP
jgi:hypothetical protein